MKRIILVTGASSGIGREFALQLSDARDADEIWILARRADKLDELAHELAARAGVTQNAAKARNAVRPTPRVVEIDLGGHLGVSRFTDLLDSERKACPNGELTIDTLVNNAGFGTYGTFIDTDLQRQLDMIDLNVRTLTGLCHAAIPFMSAGSLIINVASLAAFIPLGNFAVYGATKAYVLNFSVALAAELADAGIFVSTVCPGPVDTEFANVASNGAREKVVNGKSPSAVVAHCLRQTRNGRHMSIMAPVWKFKAFMSRFVGRYSFARYTFIHEKRPSK